MENFKNSNQMKSYMKKESNRLGLSISNTYSTFLSRLFLERISKYKTEDILVKGSCAETAYLGKLVRAITDVDLASISSFECYRRSIELATQYTSSSDINFRLSDCIKRTQTGIFKTSFQVVFDKLNQPFKVDVQEKYNRLIERSTFVMPKIFDGDEEFNIAVPSFEEYLAEKLCIIVESNKPDVLNTRVKDFYDIYQLHGGEYSSEKLTDYFKKMLILRGKISLEDASTEYLNKDFVLNHYSIWESTKEKYDFLDSEIDLFGAVYYVRAVLREELQKSGSVMSHDILKKKK